MMELSCKFTMGLRHTESLSMYWLEGNIFQSVYNNGGWLRNAFFIIMEGTWTLFCFAWVFLSVGVHGKIYKLGLLTPIYDDLEFAGKSSMAAVDMAIERINKDANYNRNGEIQLT